MELTRRTFNILCELDIFPKVLNNEIIEYVFLLYEEKHIKTIHFNRPDQYHLQAIIHNDKFYIFDCITRKLTISNMVDNCPFAFNRNICVYNIGAEELIYVNYSGIIHIFNNSCTEIRQIHIGSLCKRYSEIVVACDKICLYDSMISEYLLICDMNQIDLPQKRKINLVKFKKKIQNVQFHNNNLYVLERSSIITKLSIDGKILCTFNPNISNVFSNDFCITDNEIYLTNNGIVKVFDRYENYLRTIDCICSDKFFINNNMLYFVKQDYINSDPKGEIHVYRREKIKFL